MMYAKNPKQEIASPGSLGAVLPNPEVEQTIAAICIRLDEICHTVMQQFQERFGVPFDFRDLEHCYLKLPEVFSVDAIKEDTIISSETDRLIELSSPKHAASNIEYGTRYSLGQRLIAASLRDTTEYFSCLNEKNRSRFIEAFVGRIYAPEYREELLHRKGLLDQVIIDVTPDMIELINHELLGLQGASKEILKDITASKKRTAMSSEVIARYEARIGDTISNVILLIFDSRVTIVSDDFSNPKLNVESIRRSIDFALEYN